jgi:hypothetical protein
MTEELTTIDLCVSMMDSVVCHLDLLWALMPNNTLCIDLF